MSTRRDTQEESGSDISYYTHDDETIINNEGIHLKKYIEIQDGENSKWRPEVGNRQKRNPRAEVFN